MQRRCLLQLASVWGELASCVVAGTELMSSASQAYLPICGSGTRASTLHYVFILHDPIGEHR